MVGVDGSESSKAALSWAAEYAKRSGLRLKVVTVWHLPTNLGWSLPLPGDWSPEADARAVLEQEVKEVLGTLADLDLTLLVAEGPPAQVLTDASTSASLVVVANRGRGQFAGMLLGSVSEFLTAHAHCPVVVVRDGAGNGVGTSVE